MIAGFSTDIRQAFRQLSKSKGLAAAILATLALCIGVTTSIFSMVYALMLRPLPFDEPDRIVELFNIAPKAGLGAMPSNVVQYRDYTLSATSYETLALCFPFDGMYGDDGTLEPLRGARISFEFFSLLRIQPLLGSFFTKEQNRPGEDRVAVLTQSFWQKQLASDPDILGKTIRIDGEALRIIGVAPRTIEAFDSRIRFFRPLTWYPTAEDPIGRYSLNIFLYGRLKSGVTIEQATAEAALIERRYYDIAPAPLREFVDRSGIRVEVASIRARRVNAVRTALYLLQGGVAFVLLIGCVNVANLLLIRANARQSELAIRAALGASRRIIARQLLVESLVLSGIGAFLGTVLAWCLLKVVSKYTAGLVPHALPMALDVQVLGFAVALTLAVGLLIGVVPIVHAVRTNLSEIIQRSSRSASSSSGMRTVSSMLVIAQIAFALVLSTGAGLLIKSFANALNVAPGFDPRDVVVAHVSLPRSYRVSDEASSAVRERLAQVLKEIPGVTAAGIGLAVPFRGGLGISALSIADNPLPPGAPQPGAFRVIVMPGYMETIRLSLIEGRFLNESDLVPEKQVYVVDEAFAKKFFPGRSAVGSRFTFGDRPKDATGWGTIVGVVANVPHNGVEEKSGNPFVYQVANFPARSYTLYMRTTRPVSSIAAELRSRINALDPAIPVYQIQNLQTAINESFDNRRGIMLLLVAFAMLALSLSGLGIYGVLSYDVAQRSRDIGVRAAMGATQRQILEMILRQGLSRALIGVSIGLIGAFLLGHYISTLLFQVKPTDPLAHVAVAILLFVVIALASYLPARRAAQIDPIEALRAD